MTQDVANRDFLIQHKTIINMCAVCCENFISEKHLEKTIVVKIRRVQCVCKERYTLCESCYTLLSICLNKSVCVCYDTHSGFITRCQKYNK